MSVNRFQLIGNLTRDAEAHGEGNSYRSQFTLAQNDKWTGNDGNKREKANFFRIKAFGVVGQNAVKFLGLGSHVYVEGRIESTEYEKDGATVYGNDFIADKIEFLNTKAPGAGNTAG